MANVRQTQAVRGAVDELRRRLVDLTRRNRLLNYKHTKRSSLAVVDIDPEAAFQQLVEGRRALFRPVPEPNWRVIQENDDKRPPPDVHAPDAGIDPSLELTTPRPDKSMPTGRRPIPLQTLQYQDGLEKSLNHIRRSAASAEQETGSNLLHLVFGFLDWRATDDAATVNLAPLVMMPVRIEYELDRSQGAYRFYLRYSGEDFETNVSLQEKLRVDFHLEFPEFDAENPSAAAYWAQVERLAKQRRGWRVVPRCTLAMLNFRKLVMYRDLHPERRWATWGAIEQHPVIQDLLGYPTGDASGVGEEGGRSGPAKRRVEEPPLVLDADSSQHAAIRDALAGESMVVQGPPGTGKSQTIANLIAAAVQAGKSVLFVAEKRAALDVVYRRLKETGLERFCLELHSDRANRRTFLAELRNRLMMDRSPSPSSRLSLNQRKMQQAVSALEKYGEILLAPWESFSPDTTVFDLLWERYQLADALQPHLPQIREFRLRDADQVSRETLEWLAEAMARYSDYLLDIQERWGNVEAHPWFGTASHTLRDEPRRAVQLVQSLRSLKDAGRRLAALQEQPVADSGTRPPTELPQLKAWLDAIQALPKTSARAAVDLIPGAVRDEAPFAEAVDVVAKSKEFTKRHQALSKLLVLERAPNTEALRLTAQVLRETPFSRRLISGNYRNAKALFRSLQRLEGRVPRKTKVQWLERLADHFDALGEAGLALDQCRHKAPDLVDALARTRGEALPEGRESLERLLGEHFAGTETNLEAIEEILSVARALRTDALPEPLLNWLTDERYGQRRDALDQAAVGLREVLTKMRQLWSEVRELGGVKPDAWFPERDGSPLIADAVVERCELILDAQDELTDWLDFQAAREAAVKTYAPLVDLAEEGALPPELLKESLEFVFHNSLFEALFLYFRGLGRYPAKELERAETAFAEADRHQMGLNATQAAHELCQHRPPEGVSTGRVRDYTEMGLIRNEMSKRKRHVSVRQLLRRSIRAVQTLKPCFMMSPLSVAQYLDAERCRFDMVIMDEASQMPPEEALGAIARGAQLVVAGDPNQLPPTSFFQRHIGADEDEVPEEEDETVAAHQAESILDAGKEVWPVRRLQWHYRSRHESLIQFSNERFYDNELVVFPSPMPMSRELGVTYEPVPSGVFHNNRNLPEVQRVIDLILSHVRRHPDRSLGVVTMNYYQQGEIEEAVDRLRKTDPALEAFERKHMAEEEPLMIKNLENAQGDERDSIIISVTYGPGADGKVLQQFGPVNWRNGWRRLNVLFTRAKRNLVVVSSMEPERLSDTSRAEGARVLRSFLFYARDGLFSRAPERQNGSAEAHEVALSRALQARGYNVSTQVGVGRCRLAVGVQHPDGSGRYVLGVDGDGRSYRDFRSPRDRHRLWPQVLRDMDWHLHRVWSTEWSRKPEQCLSDLVAHVDRRIEEMPPWSPPEPAPDIAPGPAAPQVSDSSVPFFPGVAPTREDREIPSESPHRGDGGRPPQVPPTEEVPTQPEGGDTEPEIPSQSIPEPSPLPRDEHGTPTGSLEEDGLRERLEQLRDEEVLPNHPTAEGKLGVLDAPLLEQLLLKRPINLDEWLRRIPRELREAVDGEQFRKYRDDIFDLIASF